MNQLEFIQKINKIVKENGYQDVISILEDPPGRRPDEKLKKMSEFYNSEENKEIINEIIFYWKHDIQFFMFIGWSKSTRQWKWKLRVILL